MLTSLALPRADCQANLALTQQECKPPSGRAAPELSALRSTGGTGSSAREPLKMTILQPS